ncbi:hypothetical protein MSHOH_2158 [Methanosarcina horonobensis HB-1 = JCM 15518]|uniref:Uncharacterized protein n=1 Tax=Methanosarcina horonobensis HB-1 = JCM 15518 TaxID=1434110 RepID=A0A0E3SCM4_9EURY|nr:hypothetical protein [Methanosarcina horonobensis]AKB78641.1 hypothetical protein MSHOH_2158 [Methanosarcina horonobensis HB-1 = JCM 15518]
MGFYDNNQYQQAGFKAMERYDITLRVIECIDLMGDLFTTLRFGGINQDSKLVYESFINAFFKVFHITASMLTDKDIELITSIESAFTCDLSISPENASKFLKLYEDYLFAMKKAGIYDPMVIKKYLNPGDAWTDSV